MRFEEKVNIQRQDLRTGAVSGLMSLSQRLDAFQSSQRGIASGAMSMLEGKAIEQGTLAGESVPIERKDGKTIAPKFKEEKIIGGVHTKAYNKALRAAYFSSLGNDIRAAISEIKANHPDDLISYNEKVNSYAKGVIDTIDPMARDFATKYLDEKITTGRMIVQEADIKKHYNIAKDEMDKNINDAAGEAFRSARNGEELETEANKLEAFVILESAKDAGFKTDKEVKSLMLDIEKQILEQSKKGELDRLSDISMKKAYDHLNDLNKEVPKNWTPDEWQKFISSSQQELNRKESRLKKEIKELEKQQLLQESISRGLAFMNPDIPANPAKESQDREDVNNAYDVMTLSWKELPATEQFDNHVEFVKNTGIVPDKLISGINATMRSGNIDQVNIFSGLLNEIAKEPMAANILKDVPSESRAIAKQVLDSTESGIELDVAVEVARKNTFGLTEPEREQIRLDLQALRPNLADKLNTMIEKDKDLDVFIFEPDAPTALQADFNIALEKYMVLTNGNVDQSSELAFQSIKKTWAMTKIGGPKRFMKYAPEVFYSIPGVSNKWMRRQFKEDTKAFGDNVLIAIDYQNANSSRPKYSLMTTDENDLLVPIFNDEGKRILWEPDFKKTREYHKYKILPEKKINAAKDIRDRVDTLNKIIGVEKKVTKPGVI